MLQRVIFGVWHFFKVAVVICVQCLQKGPKLNVIQKDAQRFAEAIFSSLELETEIVDETLTIVAGTGRLST